VTNVNSRRPVEIGTVFNRWTTIGEVFYDDRHYGLVLCRCVCGTEKVVGLGSMKYGSSKSCGCIQVEIASRTGVENPKYRGVYAQRSASLFLQYFPMIERCQFPFCNYIFADHPDKKSGNSNINVDHDHDCGRHAERTVCIYCVRGVLCTYCNIVAGFFDCRFWPLEYSEYRYRRPLLVQETQLTLF
jgi:Recombination endonuclease VII